MYYEAEREKLLQSSMSVIRLIKYMISDKKNESKKGELISLIHAMRSNIKRGHQKKVKKPYKRDKKV